MVHVADKVQAVLSPQGHFDKQHVDRIAVDGKRHVVGIVVHTGDAEPFVAGDFAGKDLACRCVGVYQDAAYHFRRFFS